MITCGLHDYKRVKINDFSHVRVCNPPTQWCTHQNNESNFYQKLHAQNTGKGNYTAQDCVKWENLQEKFLFSS